MVKRTSIKYPLVSEYISIYNAEDHSIYSWNGIGIGIEYFDGNGTPIYVENAIDNATTRTDDALKLGMGEFLEFEFILPEEYLSKVKKFRLTSIMELPTNSQKTKDQISIDNTDNNPKMNNWDSLLDSYEEIAIEYEKLAKEMKSGNVNTSSLAKIATEALKMQEKFDDSKSELTPKQAQRLTKIAAKISQAAATAAQGSQNIQSIDGINLKDLGL